MSGESAPAPTQEEIDEAIGYIGVGLGDNEAAYAEEHRCAEIMVAAYKALKPDRSHAEAQESEGAEASGEEEHYFALLDAAWETVVHYARVNVDEDIVMFNTAKNAIRALLASRPQLPLPPEPALGQSEGTP